MSDKNNEGEICPECGGKVETESFSIICRKCGLIIDDLLLDSLLKKNYSQFQEAEYKIYNILNEVSIHLSLSKNIRNNAAYNYRKIVKNEKKAINDISLIAFCIFYSNSSPNYKHFQQCYDLHNHYQYLSIEELSRAFQNFGHNVNPTLILRAGIEYKKHLNTKLFTFNDREDYLIRLIDVVINREFLDARIVKKGVVWIKEDYKNKLIDKCRFITMDITYHGLSRGHHYLLMGPIIYLADKLLSKERNQKALLTLKILSRATNIAERFIKDHYINILKPCYEAYLNPVHFLNDLNHS